MNKANLKSYAPKARLDFIKAVTARANVLGISAAGTVPAQLRGDVVIIDGREWPAKVAGQRGELIARIKRHGFEQTMDEVAYTWFNRFAALRYMEIHDYLGHGWRVLSSRDEGLPEILRHASEVTLPGLNADRAREMQLAGNQDNELYKLLLVAQCNELSRVMPFLFERIDDETELLLPENLLRTDSIVAKLLESVPEEDWQEIEVIGWLYQFYISEKKDQVIGKVVKSEDIPAATQLFTPNWIVQYLVQNSVGRLWLMANPTSTLASQWPYYIQPAEQTPEVQAQLGALIQARIREDGETLNPETITVLDPACGSGHILVVAYDVLKAIYLERGYQLRSIPRLILEKNLYGLDIDDRAAQLAAFALLMKARADDRRLFVDPPKLNVLSLQESKGLDLEELSTNLAPFGIGRESIKSLLGTFEHAKTFGSLIQVPTGLNGQLAAMTTGLQQALQDGDLFARQGAKEVLPLVWQALVLGMQLDAVVANPPYMGNKGMNPALKEYARRSFPSSKSDLFAMFIERAFQWCESTGFTSMVTMQSWMFLSSYQDMRSALLRDRTIQTMAHLGARAFSEISGEIVQTTAFVLLQCHLDNFRPAFFRLVDGNENSKEVALRSNINRFDSANQNEFRKIPGSPIAYWASAKDFSTFSDNLRISDVSEKRLGLCTGDNDKFLRLWFEVDHSKIGFEFESCDAFLRSTLRYAPHNKGGSPRRWAGNRDFIIKFDRDSFGQLSQMCNHLASKSHYFRESLTWSEIGTGVFAVRALGKGYTFNIKGPSVFVEEPMRSVLLAYFNSSAFQYFLGFINQTISFNGGDVERVPFKRPTYETEVELLKLVDVCVRISSQHVNDDESSWDFTVDPIVSRRAESRRLSMIWREIESARNCAVSNLREAEEGVNKVFIDSFDLQDELSPTVLEDQITLTRADREKDCQRLTSYAIGCMMGRYSLDELGLIYAHAGNVDFNPSRYANNFPADADGIVPLTDERWFEDDAASRVREFLGTVWGADTLEKNMAWLAESLGTKGSETPDETIRRYLADKFFKDHLQTYKRRPIYWLFSSGKQGAFQALVYLHRYNEGTLARMRAEYVVPLIAKVMSRLDMLDKDVAAASSAAARTKLQKQIESLRKKQIELLTYDEKLRHYADMRITLDLDDGVKLNYAKFGDLVAESKAITGGGNDDI